MPTRIADLEVVTALSVTTRVYERSLPDIHEMDDQGTPVLQPRETVWDVELFDPMEDVSALFCSAATESAARSIAANVCSGLISVELRHTQYGYTTVLTAPLTLAMMPTPCVASRATARVYQRSLPDCYEHEDDEGRLILQPRQTIYDILAVDKSQNKHGFLLSAATEDAARSVAAGLHGHLIPVTVRHIRHGWGATFTEGWAALLTDSVPLARMPASPPAAC